LSNVTVLQSPDVTVRRHHSGAKLSAAISVRKAIASLGLKNVAVVTVNGEVYLTKK